MDSLIDLLPLVFVGLYYLLAGRRRAKQQRVEAPQQELVQDREPRAPTPFQSFLNQLEGAMAEAAGEPLDRPEPPRQEPIPEPAPVASAAPSVSLADAEFRPAAGSFDSARPVSHEAHGFGAANPLSEESFEQAPAFSARAPSGRPGYDPHGLHSREPRSSTPRADWRARLNDPKAAQDAFLLQTVFGPRGGRRAERHR